MYEHQPARTTRQPTDDSKPHWWEDHYLDWHTSRSETPLFNSEKIEQMKRAVARAQAFWNGTTHDGDDDDGDGDDDSDNGDDEASGATAAAAERMIANSHAESDAESIQHGRNGLQRPTVQFSKDTNGGDNGTEAMEIDGPQSEPPRSLPIIRTYSDLLRISPHKHRKYTVRYELKLKVGATQSRSAMEDAVRERILAAFALIQKADSKACVMPWKKDDWELNWLQTASDFPYGIEPLQVYFDERIYAPRNGGFIFPNVFLAHVIEPHKLNGDVQQIFRLSDDIFDIQPLQTEAVASPGWLLFSVDRQDTRQLSSYFLQHHHFRVHFRSKVISIARRGEQQPKLERKDLIRALHSEVPLTCELRATRILQDTYRKDADAFPLGVRMRLIPTVDDSRISQSTRDQLPRLRHKQEIFLHHMARVPFKGLALGALDMTDACFGDLSFKTLVLTNVFTRRDPGKQLFHSIDQSWRAGEVFFTVHPDLLSEAYAIIDGFLPYLRSRIVDWPLDIFDRFFKPSVVSASRDRVWDNQAFGAVSATDHAVAAILDIDSDYDFEIEDGDDPMLKNKDSATVDQVPRKSSAPANLATDGSVATFGLRRHPQTDAQKTPLSDDDGPPRTARLLRRQSNGSSISLPSALKKAPPSTAPAKAITTFIPATPSTVTAESAIESLQKQLDQMRTEHEQRQLAQRAQIDDLTKRLNDSNDTASQLNARVAQLAAENQLLRTPPDSTPSNHPTESDNVEMMDTSDDPPTEPVATSQSISPSDPRSADRPIPDDVSTPDSKRHKQDSVEPSNTDQGSNLLGDGA